MRRMHLALCFLLHSGLHAKLQQNKIDTLQDRKIYEKMAKGDEISFAEKYDFIVSFTASAGFQPQAFAYSDHGYVNGSMQPLYLQSRFQLEYLHRFRFGVSTLSLWILNGPSGVFDSAWSALMNVGIPFYAAENLMIGVEASVGTGLNVSYVYRTDEWAAYVFMPILPAIVVEHYWRPWLAFGLQIGYLVNYAGEKKLPAQPIIGLSTTFRMD